MKRLLKAERFLFILGYLFIIGFVVRLAADYYKYQNGFDATPFYLLIIGRSLTFLLPSILCFMIAKFLKRNK